MLYVLYLLVIGALVGLDQITKFIVVKNFDLYDYKTVINNFFDIRYIQNYGAGFSIFQNQREFLSIIALVAIAVLVYLLLSSKKSEVINRIAYLLVISGTIGNLVDRIRLGYVIDFLDFLIFTYDFPVFNVADCFITIGCFLLIITILLESKNAKN